MLVLPLTAQSADISRFVYSGDGRIRIISQKNGTSFSGHYRRGPAGYDLKALQAIHGVFDAPFDANDMQLSLRFLEFMDFLEDHLRPGAWITLTSGYRSPEYNRNLRQKGALAAKASLHQYGMAADLKMEGVSAKRIWDYVKGLHFGGAGYYHGQSVHLDVGPARSWDETTSGVGTGISDDNKLIGINTDFDRYLPGETLTLRFIRMTAFPIGVAADFELVSLSTEIPSAAALSFKPKFKRPAQDTCPRFNDIAQMDGIRWRLPDALAPGQYAVQARFCGNPWEQMPPQIRTPAFTVLAP